MLAAWAQIAWGTKSKLAMAKLAAVALVFAIKPPVGLAFVVGELVAGDLVGMAAALLAVGLVWYLPNAWVYGAEWPADWLQGLRAYPQAVDLGWWRAAVVAAIIAATCRRHRRWFRGERPVHRTAAVAFAMGCLGLVPGIYALSPLAVIGRSVVGQALALPLVFFAAGLVGWTSPPTYIVCFLPLFAAAIYGRDDRHVWPALYDLLTLRLAVVALGLGVSFLVLADLRYRITDVDHLAVCADLMRQGVLYDPDRWPVSLACAYAPVLYVPFGVAPIEPTRFVGKLLSFVSLWSLAWTLGARGRLSPAPFLCAPILVAARFDNPTLWLVALLAWAVRGRR